MGAGERYQAIPNLPAGSLLRIASLHCEYGTEPRCPSLVVERHREINL